MFSPAADPDREERERRRYNCGQQAEWDERAVAAVSLWNAHRDAWEGQVRNPLAVADFGAGNERLRPLLGAELGVDLDYHPYDLHPQQPTTARLDVSQGLPDRDFDLAICLGLLEYLPSLPDLAAALHAGCRFAITSYVASDSPLGFDRERRAEHGWTTHLSGRELETAFLAAGFSLVGTSHSDQRATSIWLWAADNR